ncbi:pentatricopeptide repeat-containing protein At1g11290, chloroplastic [Setaria italica]|nr:pentatricopeptide repeat-containing protein At1g11290, chloroplastic [Setaria italica]
MGHGRSFRFPRSKQLTALHRSPAPALAPAARPHGMRTLYSAVKRRINLRLRRPPLASPATPPRHGCHSHSSCGPREAAVSHDSLLLRLQSGPVLAEVRRLHAALLVRGYRRSTVLAAQLVRAYARLGDAGLGHALRVFDGMPRRNSFAWNAVIKALVDAGRFSEALERYWDMVSDGLVAADRFTYPPVLKACAVLGAIEQGRRVRENIEIEIAGGSVVPNVFVQCALVDMFAKCGCLGEARSVFESMGVRDLAAWTAIIGGAVHEGDWFEVMNLFNRMRSEGFLPDSVIFATVIPACGRVKELRTGMALQGCAVRCGVGDDTRVSNALVDMYCKCAYLDMAASLFWSIDCKDVVSWSTIIAGHSQNGMYCSSVKLFTEMVSSGVKPNSTTLATILPSLSELKLSRYGKAIHCFSVRNGLDRSEFLVSAFIDFYSKQGLIGEAETVFEFTPKKDLVIWNSMVGGYAVNVDYESALHALRELQKVGLRPDHVTVVSVLPLCNRHSWLIQGL